MQSHQGRVGGRRSSQNLLFTPLLITPIPQDAIGFFGHKGTVLAPAVHQDPQIHFPYAALQQISPHPILVPEVDLA